MLKKIYDNKEFIRGFIFGMIVAVTAIVIYGMCNGEYIIGATITVITFAIMNYMFAKIIVDAIFDIIRITVNKETGKDIEEGELI